MKLKDSHSPVWRSTLKCIKADLLGDFRADVEEANAGQFQGLVVKSALLCNRGAAWIDKKSDDYAVQTEIIGELAGAIAEVVGLFTTDDPKTHFEDFGNVLDVYRDVIGEDAAANQNE